MTMGETPRSRLAELFSVSRLQGEVSQELEKSFFDCLRAKNGVYMTTYPNRLDDLNTWSAKYVPAARPLRILDVGISCGVSTLEWAQSLDREQLEYEMIGVDLTTKGVLVSFGSRLHVVLDSAKRPLLFEINREWLSNPPGKRRTLRYLSQLTILNCGLLIWKQRDGNARERMNKKILGMPVREQEIELVTPRLKSHSRVTIREGNIMTDYWGNDFQVIRAANILNRAYFDRSTLTRILLNLRRQLAVGGILIVCRTNDENGVNRASIFHLREDDRFDLLAQMSGGSEIEDVALQLSPAEDKRLGTTMPAVR